MEPQLALAIFIKVKRVTKKLLAAYGACTCLVVVHVVKELLQIKVDTETVAIVDDGLSAPQGLMGASMRTETKTIGTELRFV